MATSSFNSAHRVCGEILLAGGRLELAGRDLMVRRWGHLPPSIQRSITQQKAALRDLLASSRARLAAEHLARQVSLGEFDGCSSPVALRVLGELALGCFVGNRSARDAAKRLLAAHPQLSVGTACGNPSAVEADS